jgi:hypothetical protein
MLVCLVRLVFAVAAWYLDEEKKERKRDSWLFIVAESCRK